MIGLVCLMVETGRSACQVHTPKIRIHGGIAARILAMQERVLFQNRTSRRGCGHYIKICLKRHGDLLITGSRLTLQQLDSTDGTPA